VSNGGVNGNGDGLVGEVRARVARLSTLAASDSVLMMSKLCPTPTSLWKKKVERRGKSRRSFKWPPRAQVALKSCHFPAWKAC